MAIGRGKLAGLFQGVGAKRLSAVDAEPARSNQHEIGTTKKMLTDFMGEDRKEGLPVNYVWLGGDQDGIVEQGTATHYDTRENQPHRSPEWRLYYYSNSVTQAMQEGDTLFLAKHTDGTLWFIVAPAGSTSERQLFWLFDIEPEGLSFRSREVAYDEPDLDFAARFILDELGIEFEEPDADKLDTIIDRYASGLKTASQLSDMARLTLPEVRAEDDPDTALMLWLDQEEALFRRLEHLVVNEDFQLSFGVAAARAASGKLALAQDVRSSRELRKDLALENHLEAIFRAFSMAYDKRKPNGSQRWPEFLFRGITWHVPTPEKDQKDTVMLAAQSICTHRWQCVLADGGVPVSRHLLTLEPGISASTTHEMELSGLQLVVPAPVQATYTQNQRKQLWRLAEFIESIGELADCGQRT